MSVAKREIPADPARFAVLKAENAAERARAIVGRQHQIISCFWCQRDWPEGSDGYRPWSGPDYVCADESACLDRAAQAGAVLAFGQPGDGGAAS